MIFSEKSSNKIGILKLNDIKIKSKIYAYTSFYDVLFLKENIILKLSPFIITRGRKEKWIYFYNQDTDFLFKDFFNKKYSITNNNEILPLYIKRRLGNLGLLMKNFGMDRIKDTEFIKFMFYDISSINLLKKIAQYLRYRENYKIQDIRNLYLNCCKRYFNKQIYYFMKDFYKLDIDFDKVKKELDLKYQVIKTLSELYNIPFNIVKTYNKTINKLVHYIEYKKESLDNIRKKLEEYKAYNNDIHLNVEDLIKGKVINFKKISKEQIENINNFKSKIKVVDIDSI